MNTQLDQDLKYIADAVRRQDVPVGLPFLFFLWAALVLVGFAMPDFAPRFAGIYWLFAGFGGGLLSYWYASRKARDQGILNKEEGRRYGFHWLIGGLAYLLVGIPMITGKVDPNTGATYYLLVTGVLYSLAGVHLQRGLLPGGLITLAGFALLSIVQVEYVWTITGVLVSIALVLGGLSAQRAIRRGARP